VLHGGSPLGEECSMRLQPCPSRPKCPKV
jgi:hypothetical protein